MNQLRRWLPLVGVLLALLVVFRLWVPRFLSADNLIDLVQQVSVNAILAFGMTLVILSGGIDLSVGAVLALVGTATTYVMVEQGLGLPIWAAMFAGFAVAAAFGLFHGLCASRTRIPPFVVTLATMQIARGCALRFNEGRPLSIPDEYAPFLNLGVGRAAGVPMPVLIMLGVFLACTYLLHATRFGQHLYAIGGNREAARFAGIPVARVETAVYLICALLAGLAGMVHTAQLYSAAPASGQGYELNAIAAAVVGGASFSGGRGAMPGTLLGAVIIGILDKGLNQAGVHFSFQYMVKGVVILAAVFADVLRKR